MKLNKKIGNVFFFVIMILLFVSSVSALGISPARKIFDFESGLQESVEFKVINNENKDMKVVVYAEDVFNGASVIVDTSELSFSAGESEKIVRYSFSLPDKMDKPGDHSVKIVAREIPVDSAVSGTEISSAIAVVHELKIKVPYPGKYVETDLKIAETDKSNEVNFIISVNNLGTQKIVNAKGIIDIYGPTNDKIASVETSLSSIDAGLRKDLTAVWTDENINSGKYYAKLTLTYDGEVAEAERIFNVGSLEVDIIDINVKDFRLGEIAKFNILVENSWSELINDAYCELVISENGDEIGSFKSASEDIHALSKGELTAFWDTAGVKEGEYDAKAILYYAGKSIEKDMRAVISLNSISFDLFGAGAVVADGGVMDKSDIIIIALVVLVIINIGWFVYFKRRKRKR